MWWDDTEILGCWIEQIDYKCVGDPQYGHLVFICYTNNILYPSDEEPLTAATKTKWEVKSSGVWVLGDAVLVGG